MIKLCHFQSVPILSLERPRLNLSVPVYIRGPESSTTCWKSQSQLLMELGLESSFWIPNIFYFSLGQVGLNGIPDPENWARTEGGMLQQTSLFGRTPSQQAFCQVAWCTRFSFKLCIWTQPAEGTSIVSQSCTQSFSLWAFSATLLLKGREK